MWTPATALLWECWRLSRWFLAILIFVPTLLGTTILFTWSVVPAAEHWPDLHKGPTWAFLFAVQAGMIGGSWAASADARRGFKLALGFARPIPTWVLVTVPMAYIGVSCAVTYLVPMLALRTAFDVPLPHFAIAPLVSTVGLLGVAFFWWTGDSTRQRVAWAVLWILGWSWYYKMLPPRTYDVVRSPEFFSFSAAAYALMALVSLAAVGVTIVGVARQRRGDDRLMLALPAPKTAVAPAVPALAERIGVRCPVASPTRAQLWFEMSTAGRTVLKYGALAALVGPAALTLVAPPGDLFFFAALLFIVPPVVGLRSMLDIRRQHGSFDLGSFAATRAMGTARLVGLKVLVTSLSVIAAWAAIATSLGIFVVWLAVWGPGPAADLADLVRSLPVYAWIGLVVAVVTSMAYGLTLHSLLVLNPRRFILSAMGLALCIALSVGAAAMGWATPDEILMAHWWIVTGAAIAGPAVLLRRLAAERIFTSRGLIAVLGLWTGIALVIPDREAWLTISCLPLAAAALAPWSFSRLRHR